MCAWQYFSWNPGLRAGFGSYFIATVLTCFGYVSLIMCLAEMSSAMPFAGTDG
jgi:ethanolamine permease